MTLAMAPAHAKNRLAPPRGDLRDLVIVIRTVLQLRLDPEGLFTVEIARPARVLA